jgi:hypothetical protein
VPLFGLPPSLPQDGLILAALVAGHVIAETVAAQQQRQQAVAAAGGAAAAPPPTLVAPARPGMGAGAGMGSTSVGVPAMQVGGYVVKTTSVRQGEEETGGARAGGRAGRGAWRTAWACSPSEI